MRTLTFRGYLAMAVVGLLVAVGWMAAGTVRAQEAGVRHATGTFEVSVTPADPEVKEAGLGLSRYSLSKTFTGGMSGVSVGQMLAGGPSDDVGTYVALERFVGTLDGREGAFLLAHRGDMNAGGYTLSITVVPNSGTGALEGISGDFALTIAGGEHSYDLSYSLPPE
ncbi:DUF3224 domain-containing protein [Brevundimonas staleyi]|uniref:DUF3224 domain-containing protein n=1 Tax=Brevundimonas staleyi TaxID=74326 RepID=A0ABW0FS15_9CAUL